MKTPVLESERLILRPLKTDDAETVFNNWSSNPVTTRYMQWNTHSTISETEEWLKTEEIAACGDDNYTWGRGITSEAVQKIIAFAGSELELQKMFGKHAKDNPASGRIMEKHGFSYQKAGKYTRFNGNEEFESREYILYL